MRPVREAHAALPELLENVATAQALVEEWILSHSAIIDGVLKMNEGVDIICKLPAGTAPNSALPELLLGIFIDRRTVFAIK